MCRLRLLVLRRSTAWIALVAGWLPCAALLAPRTAGAGVMEPWEVGEVGRPGQYTIYNRTMMGAWIGFPLAAGDMNGDRRADLILTPMNADSGPNTNRISAGEAIIVLSPAVIEGQRNLALLDLAALPSDVTLVFGADNFDYLGTQVDAADLDGDGYADAIVGAQYGDGAGNGRAESGEIVIVWGGPAVGGRTIDLAAPPEGAVTFVYGANPGDRLGAWVSSGDVDGDGVEDAILGADEANPDGNHFHAGVTYVLYGSAALRSLAAVDLASPGVPVTAINGIDQEDHSGATVRAADLNRDGAAEVLIGAGLNRLSASIGPNGAFGGHGSGGGDGPNNEGCGPATFECNVGEAYIVYGQRGVRPRSIDLRSPPASTTIIYGIDGGPKTGSDAYGEELFAGDFNGDGWGDVAIGAITADGPGNTRSNAGELALILGRPDLAGSVIDLTDPPPNTTFFYGRRAGAIAGDTIMMLDVDGDGRDEVVIACPNDNPGRVEAGTNFVFFGTSEPLPSSIDLAAIPAELSYLVINGADSLDMLAYSMGLGDVNGDGLTDMVLNAMGGDGFDNLLEDAGDAYVLDSVAVTHFAGREVAPPRTPTSTVLGTPTATSTQTPENTVNATPTVTPPPSVCTGDCDAGGTVTIDELITAVRIALDELPPSACSAADADANGSVSIGELIGAVARTLSGC